MHDVIWKDDLAFVGFLKYASLQKHLNVAMYCLNISP